MDDSGEISSLEHTFGWNNLNKKIVQLIPLSIRMDEAIWKKRFDRSKEKVDDLGEIIVPMKICLDETIER